MISHNNNHHHHSHHHGLHKHENDYMIVDSHDLQNLQGLNLQSLVNPITPIINIDPLNLLWNPVEAYRDFWKIKHEKKYNMSWQEIVTAAGFDHEQHEVTTEDGYTLGVWRIKSKDLKPGAPVVFLQHGLFASADHWIAHKAEKAPAFQFARAGYDVWLGNNRGNNHSRKPTKSGCNPDRNKANCYYDYSFQELGKYDLPAQVDFVLGKTGHKKLTYVGHSQGTTQMFYGLATNQRYFKDRINLFVAMAPVMRLEHVWNDGLKAVAANKVFLLGTLENLGFNALMTPNWHRFGYTVCKTLPAICNLANTMMDMGSKYNDNQEEDSFGSKFPQAASWKQVMHFSQLVTRKNFRAYDYQKDKNLEVYGTEKPPLIDVSIITDVPIAMYVGKQDDLATTTDARWAKKTIPAIKHYEELDNCDHGTFMTGLDMSFMDSVLEQVKTYNTPENSLMQLWHNLGGLF